MRKRDHALLLAELVAAAVTRLAAVAVPGAVGAGAESGGDDGDVALGGGAAADELGAAGVGEGDGGDAGDTFDGGGGGIEILFQAGESVVFEGVFAGPGEVAGAGVGIGVAAEFVAEGRSEDPMMAGAREFLAKPCSLDELIEKQPPLMSAGPILPSRAFLARSLISWLIWKMPFLSASRITGTTRPCGVSAAKPMW